MVLTEFLKLSDRDKWEIGKTLTNVKWACPNCKSIVDDGEFPDRCPGFSGMSMHCGECDFELTRRTGGGQSDPFNFIFIDVV